VTDRITTPRSLSALLSADRSTSNNLRDVERRSKRVITSLKGAVIVVVKETKTEEKRMLDLDVQPERSVGNELWEFILGKDSGLMVNPRDTLL